MICGAVLHVEDDTAVRDAVSMLLRGAGYQIASAADGREAEQLVAAGMTPDVLIIDYHLDEELNGADVAQLLRRCLGYSPPIIMLTADPTGAELPWITDAPIWLARKPLDSQLLLAALPGLIQVSQATRALQRAARSS
jgi:DNA-binding response OmpR family regulator